MTRFYLPLHTLASLTALGLTVSMPALAQTTPPTQPTPSPAIPSALPAASPSPILPLSVDQAVMMAIENNRALAVERFGLRLAEQDALREGARFDPSLTAKGTIGNENAQRALGASNDLLDVITYTQNYQIGLQKTFPTGTTIAVDAGTTFSGRQTPNGNLNQQISRMGLSFTQALLQGRDPAVNLARIRQAELATSLEGYNLRGFAEALVAETELAFWNYLQARQQQSLTEASLALSQQQLKDTQARVEIGRQAGIEATLFEAEIATRQQELVTARGTVEKARLSLLRLLSPDLARWADYRVEMAAPMGVPEVHLDSLNEHLQAALQSRPEIHQTKLEIQRRELEVVRTRDGLLPRLDVFLTLGKSGYADSLLGSLANLPGRGYDFSTGFSFSYPLGARAADADYSKAQLSQAEQEEALRNLQQLIELDVRTAYLDIRIAREQIDAARTARALQQIRLQGEIDRFEAGVAGAFPITQAQRDLLAAQISEVNAVMDYLKRITTFYRLEGTLLARRGISTVQIEGRPEPGKG